MVDGLLPTPGRILLGVIPRRARLWAVRKALPNLDAEEQVDPEAPLAPTGHPVLGHG